MAMTWPGSEWESVHIPDVLDSEVFSIKTEAARIGFYGLFATVSGRAVLQYGAVNRSTIIIPPASFEILTF